jgi:hypothetical protein
LYPNLIKNPSFELDSETLDNEWEKFCKWGNAPVREFFKKFCCSEESINCAAISLRINFEHPLTKEEFCNLVNLLELKKEGLSSNNSNPNNNEVKCFSSENRKLVPNAVSVDSNVFLPVLLKSDDLDSSIFDPSGYDSELSSEDLLNLFLSNSEVDDIARSPFN